MSKEAMKLALDALEVATTPLANDRQEVLRAQAALREALAEKPAQGCEYCNHPLYAGTKCKNCGRVTEQAAIKRDLTPERPAQQEPVAFYVYKPTLPRGHLGTVSDGDLPWVYDQDPSSGFSARMLVAPVTSPPAQRKPLTDEQIVAIIEHADGSEYSDIEFARAIEAAHGIKENT